MGEGEAVVADLHKRHRGPQSKLVGDVGGEAGGGRALNEKISRNKLIAGANNRELRIRNGTERHRQKLNVEFG